MTLTLGERKVRSMHVYVILTLTLLWITLFMVDMGEGALHREDEVTVKQRN
jgi:hypothetical protein